MEPEEEPSSRRAVLASICVLALLVAGGLWLSGVLGSSNAVQDCVASGRTNCAPIDTQSR